MAKPTRPSLSSFMVTHSVAAMDPPLAEIEEAVAEPDPALVPNIVSARKGRVAKAAPAKVETEAFRTSVYFHRVVHDKLRDIAHAERKSVMDLINEGLDHVLASRNYPTTGQLRGKE